MDMVTILEKMRQPFRLPTPEETHAHHRVLTAALQSNATGQVAYL